MENYLKTGNAFNFQFECQSLPSKLLSIFVCIRFNCKQVGKSCNNRIKH